jgi:tRNA (cmo5U34)-methyltransferase
MTQSKIDSAAHFKDSAAISDYAERTRRLVPGWSDLQRMAALLIAERAPEDACVLVVGAGGGAELTTFAQSYSQWRFVGVDPSASMLELAASVLGPLIERVQLHQGYVDTAPAGPFDAATCLLTMHFVAADERRRMLKQIRSRLKPGAPFVIAHMSFPQSAEEKKLWLSRYAAFAIASGVEPQNARNAASAIEANLPVIAPAQEEQMLGDAGFSDTQLFYAGLAFRGWVTYA